MKILRIKGFEIMGVKRYLGEEINCFYSNRNIEDDDFDDFLTQFRNAGLEIKEEDFILLDTRGRKVSSIVTLFGREKKSQIITYKRSNFLLTSQKRYIGIKGKNGKNTVPLAIYFKQRNDLEKILVAGIVRHKVEIDLRNLSVIFLILNTTSEEPGEEPGSLTMMIGPSASANSDFLIDFLEMEKMNIEKIYQCEYQCESDISDNFNIIFYFNL
jgi:hypothetical protein